MIKEIYSASWEGDMDSDEWAVIGPGTYIPCRADKRAAYELASRLNNAYILGYAKVTHIEEIDT